MSDETGQRPRVFVSYSWTSQEHSDQVREWAERLVADGVDVVLDQWDLKEGHDRFAFMEQMVTAESVTKVVIFSDARYAQRADSRTGGVGSEAQIISAELYGKVRQEKFIPVLCEVTSEGEPCLPVYLRPRIYLDFSSPEAVARNYEKLLRAIYDKPMHVKPALGIPPSYLLEDTAAPSPTTGKLRALKEALQADRSTCPGLFSDLLDAARLSMEAYEFAQQEGTPDDEAVVGLLSRMQPLRDDLVAALYAVFKFKDEEHLADLVAEFLESLLPFRDPLRGRDRASSISADHYGLFIHELFLYLIAILVKWKRFRLASGFLEREYLQQSGSADGRLQSFQCFYFHSQALAARDVRLKRNRISPHADLLLDRATLEEAPFPALAQADIILMLKSFLAGRDWPWYPVTGVFLQRGRQGGFELFVRARSARHWQGLQTLFNVSSAQEFSAGVKRGIQDKEPHSWPVFGYHWGNLLELLKLDELGTRP
jgi:hypothetical protein